jgi:hypothetical protein
MGEIMGNIGAILVAALVALCQPASSQTADFSASGTLPYCLTELHLMDGPGNNSADEAFQAGYCRGLVRGLHVLSQAFKVMCPADGVTQGQSVQVIVGYINAHPERVEERFELLAMDAFREAWPCSKQ